MPSLKTISCERILGAGTISTREKCVQPGHSGGLRLETPNQQYTPPDLKISLHLPAISIKSMQTPSAFESLGQPPPNPLILPYISLVYSCQVLIELVY